MELIVCWQNGGDMTLSGPYYNELTQPDNVGTFRRNSDAYSCDRLCGA